MVEEVLCRDCGAVKPRRGFDSITNGSRSGGVPRGRCPKCRLLRYGAGSGYVAPSRLPQKQRGDEIRVRAAERKARLAAEAQDRRQAAALRQAEYRALVAERGVLCRKCREIKPADDFHRFLLGQRSPDGPHGECRACLNARCRKGSPGEPPSARLARDRRAAASADRLRNSLALCRRCRERKPRDCFGPPTGKGRSRAEVCLECDAKHRRGRCRTCAAPMAEAHKPCGWSCEICRAAEKAVWRNGRTRRLVASDDGTASREAIAALLAAAEACPYCGADLRCPSEPALDHIRPIAGRGYHGISNLLACCNRCNRRKYAKPFHEWLATLAEPFKSRCERLYRKRFGAPPTQMPLI